MIPNIILRDRPLVYGIRNLANGKIYVGRTHCIYKRAKQHARRFEVGAPGHKPSHLYHALAKYGPQSFDIFPLEFCDDLKKLPAIELKWIEKLKTFDRKFGYNLRCDGADGPNIRPETREKFRANLKRQWADGVRDAHSEKLKKNWAKDPNRRSAQGDFFREKLTKWTYTVWYPDGPKVMNYAEIVKVGLRSAMCGFYARYSRPQSNVTTFRGLKIERTSTRAT